ncbi:MAG: nucleotidyltransferase family protein [Meiothermus sp.]|nr:nucleotidyltransferase family protein [Meiothermus sp.]
MPPLDAIILSAGSASRFGIPKFLLPAGKGHVLLTRVLEQALRVADGRIAVVVGREAKVARYAVKNWLAAQPGNPGSRVVTVINRYYWRGQSSSLKVGVRTLNDSEGVLVLLADMPLLAPEKLAQQARAIRSRGPQTLAVAAAEMGQIRPPVFLSRPLFPEVLKLRGDLGARALLKAHREAVLLVEWGSGPWFLDVDDWQTYRTVAQSMNWDREAFVPPRRQTIPVSVACAKIDKALASPIVPWLAPGILLLPSNSESLWLWLSRSYRGVRSLVVGPAQTPAAYLELIQRATLAALANETDSPGDGRDLGA